MNLEQKLRAADRRAVALNLPEGVALVEFVRFSVFDFQAVPARGEPQWKPARYVAFVLPGGEPDDVQMIDLGEAEPIDRLIADFRAGIIAEAETGDGRDMAKRREEAASDRGERCRLGPASGPVRPAGSGPRESHATADRSRRRPGAAPLRGPAHRRRPPPDRRLSDQLPELRPRRAPLRRRRHRPARRAVGRRRPGFRPRNGHVREPAQPKPASGPAARPRQESHETPTHRSRARNRRAPPGATRATWTATAVPTISIACRARGPRASGSPPCSAYPPGSTPRPWRAGSRPLAARRESSTWPPTASSCPTSSATSIARAGASVSTSESSPARTDGLARLSGPMMENPMLRSGLALAGANTWLKAGNPPEEAEDGLLTAEDVTGLDLLATELVVLSACETGLGQVHVGEGVFGLRRAFVLAGAKTLVMSLWKVPDEPTRELMEDFYGRLLAGEGRAEALRRRSSR